MFYFLTLSAPVLFYYAQAVRRVVFLAYAYCKNVISEYNAGRAMI